MFPFFQKSLFSLLALFSSNAQTTESAALEVTVPIFNNVSCPIMGKPVSTRLFVETSKGRFYVCCKKCNAKILEDVDTAHKSAYPHVQKIGNETCPITGNKIEKEAYKMVLQGFEFSLCCEKCTKEALENSQIVLTKLNNPKVVDAKNTVCPVTGKAVEKNVFCLIGNDLVHLSSTPCIDEVRKDPKKVLARLKELENKK